MKVNKYLIIIILVLFFVIPSMAATDGHVVFLKQTQIADPGDSSRQVEFDNLFHAMLVADIAHHEIHEGDMYHMYKSDVAMADNDTIEIAFTTPTTATPQKRCHAIFKWRAEGDGNFQVVEGVTSLAVGSGAALVPINRQRGSIKTSSVSVPVTGQTGAAITYSGGTTIWQEIWGGAVGNVAEDRAIAEFVLAPNTSYVFRITNSSGGAQIGDMSVIWYEHTDE